MSGLVLKLGPRERVMINGVVMENGDRRTRLNILTPDANVLRLRDAIHPDEANTPVRRVCYIAQLVLAGEADARGGAPPAAARASNSSARCSAIPTAAPSSTAATEAVLAGRFYQAMRALRALMPREARLLGARHAG
jgi:flagellar biosynthesis repressor protein FlbT